MDVKLPGAAWVRIAPEQVVQASRRRKVERTPAVSEILAIAEMEVPASTGPRVEDQDQEMDGGEHHEWGRSTAEEEKERKECQNNERNSSEDCEENDDIDYCDDESDNGREMNNTSNNLLKTITDFIIINTNAVL